MFSGNLELIKNTFIKPNSKVRPDNTAILRPEKNIFIKHSDKLLSGEVFIKNIVRGYKYSVQLTYDDDEGYKNMFYLPTIQVSRNVN